MLMVGICVKFLDACSHLIRWMSKKLRLAVNSMNKRDLLCICRLFFFSLKISSIFTIHSGINPKNLLFYLHNVRHNGFWEGVKYAEMVWNWNYWMLWFEFSSKMRFDRKVRNLCEIERYSIQFEHLIWISIHAIKYIEPKNQYAPGN